MKPEILEFYADRKKHVAKMVSEEHRPGGTTPEQVRAAAVEFYNEIAKFRTGLVVLKSGEIVKNIGIAWAVWRIAKHIRAEEEDFGTADENERLAGRYKRLEILSGVLAFIVLVCSVLRIVGVL